MPKDGEIMFLWGLAILLLLVMVGGMFLTADCVKNEWRTDAISRGVARYHPVTGEWEWTVEKREETGDE